MRTTLMAIAMVAGLAVAGACGGDDDEPAPESPSPASTRAASSTPGPTVGTTPPAVTVEKVAGGFSRPTFVTNAGDGSNRLFVLEKPGVIRIVKDGATLTTPFLDIKALVRSSGNEQGLLGLAFHPKFEQNGRFWVAYTALNSANTVAEYQVSPAGSDRADATSAQVLFAVPDQFSNHNGGMLAFGPDGYLYISMGDGGSSGDPDGNGQKLSSLLGKLLRIDVDGAKPYAIPASNPFANQAGAAKEVWAYGLRNPWRFSFDRATGDIWIGDVGQNKYEEIDFQPANSKGGENYGWNTMEGAHCYKPASDCQQDGLVKPAFEYDHGDGCSVTGGYVYRGKAIPGLVGRYLFTDYCTPTFWATAREGSSFTTIELGELPSGVSSFGEDEAGELYITVDGEGAVYRIVGK